MDEYVQELDKEMNAFVDKDLCDNYTRNQEDLDKNRKEEEKKDV